MNFSARNSDLSKGLQAAIICATIGIQREYTDAFKITLESTKDGIKSYANNGNVALTRTFVPTDFSFSKEGSITVKTVELLSVLNSFSANEILLFAIEGNEIIITAESDKDKTQTLPAEVRQIGMPDLATKFSKEISLKRDILLTCLKKVTYALGFEHFNAHFMYSILRLAPNYIRAVGGDGSRFPIYELEGDGLIDVQKMNVAIHREHNSIIEKLLNTSNEEEVQLKEYLRKNDNDLLANQTVFKFGDVTFVLLGHDPGVKYVDENKFLNRESKYFITTKVSDWLLEMKGIMATKNEDVRKSNQVHTIQMNFDGKKKVLTMSAGNTMKAVRKIPLIDYDGPTTEINFRCVSDYVDEMIKNSDDGYIQFELLDEKQPLVVRTFASEKISKDIYRVNATNIKEKYSAFIASFNKK